MMMGRLITVDKVLEICDKVFINYTELEELEIGEGVNVIYNGHSNVQKGRAWYSINYDGEDYQVFVKGDK